MKLTTDMKDYTMTLEAIEVGKDLNVLIYGGQVPHIGAVAVAMPCRLAHQPDHITTSTSLISLPGHKEDLLARSAAETISKSLDKNVVVCCGIHVHAVSKEEIIRITAGVEELTKKYIEAYTK